MKYRPRQGRTLFLAYLCCAYVLILMAAPFASALEPASMGRSSAGGSAPPRIPSFEQLDRNKDGFIAISESAALPGLSATFERADRNRDGRLDKVEFARALAFLDTGR
jgi:Ca2+-binding EF-hand superfamily protein